MSTIKRNELDYIYTDRFKEEEKLFYTSKNRYARTLILPIKLKIINLYNLGDPNVREYLLNCTEHVLSKEKEVNYLINEINKVLPEINKCGWTWRYLKIILVPEKKKKSNNFKRIPDISSILNTDLQYIHFLNKGTVKLNKLIIYRKLININSRTELVKIVDYLLNLSFLTDSNSRVLKSFMKKYLLELYISRIKNWI